MDEAVVAPKPPEAPIPSSGNQLIGEQPGMGQVKKEQSKNSSHPAFRRLSGDQPVESNTKVAKPLNSSNIFKFDKPVGSEKVESEVEVTIPTQEEVNLVPTPMEQVAQAPAQSQLDPALLARIEELSTEVKSLQQPEVKKEVVLPPVDFTSLEHLDVEVAKEVQEKFVVPLQEVYEEQITNLKREFEAQLTEVNNQFTSQSEKASMDQVERTNAAIIANFDNDITQAQAWLNSKEWDTYKRNKIPGTPYTVEDVTLEAYQKNDPDTVIYHLKAMMDELKNKPNLSSVSGGNASPSKAEGGGEPSTNEKFNYADLKALRSALSRGRITREDYQKVLADFNTARIAGLVE